MLFDVLQVAFSGFICYCLYLVVIVPRREQDKIKSQQVDAWLEAIKKDSDK